MIRLLAEKELFTKVRIKLLIKTSLSSFFNKANVLDAEYKYERNYLLVDYDKIDCEHHSVL